MAARQTTGGGAGRGAVPEDRTGRCREPSTYPTLRPSPWCSSLLPRCPRRLAQRRRGLWPCSLAASRPHGPDVSRWCLRGPRWFPQPQLGLESGLHVSDRCGRVKRLAASFQDAAAFKAEPSCRGPTSQPEPAYSREAASYREAGGQQGLAYAPEAVYESTEAPGHYQGGKRVPCIAPGLCAHEFHCLRSSENCLLPAPVDWPVSSRCPQGLRFLPGQALDTWGRGTASAGFPEAPCSFWGRGAGAV